MFVFLSVLNKKIMTTKEEIDINSSGNLTILVVKSFSECSKHGNTY